MVLIRKVIKTFGVEYLQILDEEGTIDESLRPDLTEDRIKEIYHLMVLARMFDEKLFKLQRMGKIGTYAPIKGQEAAQIGTAFAISKDDWTVPTFREFGVYLARGADRVKLVQVWNGDTRAFHGDAKDLPVAIPVGSQALHGVGIAWASKMRGENKVALTYFGDGATSEGDVLEAFNFAGAFGIPVIFVCQDNQWAISTPRKVQTAAETIAQKAIAFGFKGLQVDGNDVLAVYAATKEAVERARKGEPTLLELMTYRMSDHTTSDDASKYRTEADVHAWDSKDPVLRLEKFFRKQGWWTDDYGAWVRSECEKEINDAVEKGLAIPPPPPEDMFSHIFAEMIPDHKRQLEELKAELGDAQ